MTSEILQILPTVQKVYQDLWSNDYGCNFMDQSSVLVEKL